MDWLFDGIGDWLKQLFIDAIMASLTGMFDDVNAQVQDIAVQVGTTPEGWNPQSSLLPHCWRCMFHQAVLQQMCLYG